MSRSSSAAPSLRSALRSALDPGTVLADTYEIVGRVGEGGMGVVYEARHRRLPGRFAVKVLAEAEPTAIELARFRRETEIAASLRHPHIVQVIDFNVTADGRPFYVMELLEGCDLGAALASAGPMPPSQVISIVQQVAAALAAAHGAGVVHRDLKPQNVFLTTVPGTHQPLAKVLDFGISKQAHQSTFGRERVLLGTPAYMSPEQARAEGEDIDGRSDQFALAAIAYELLSGRPAFAAPDPARALYRVTYEEPAALPAGLSAFEPVLRRALSKHKGGRFLSILEFSNALTVAGAGAGPGAPALPAGMPTLRDHAPRSGAARRWLALVAAPLALSGAALAIWGPPRRAEPAGPGGALQRAPAPERATLAGPASLEASAPVPGRLASPPPLAWPPLDRPAPASRRAVAGRSPVLRADPPSTREPSADADASRRLDRPRPRSFIKRL
jgi:serine/threonine-protein kinase